MSGWEAPFGEFRGQHAIVAGVGKGSIGAALVGALLKLGANVTAVDIHSLAPSDIIEVDASEKLSLLCLQADLAIEAERSSMLNASIKRFGCPTYFVSTIGKDDRVEFSMLSQQEMQSFFAANFAAPFWTAKDLIPTMRDGGGGSMVLFTSHHADRITDTSMVGYGCAKAALNRAIGYLAAEAGRSNTPKNTVRINGFCPGWVWTPNQIERFDEKEQSAAVARQAIRVAMYPTGLVGNVLAMLAKMTSEYMTGAIVNSDGGVESKVLDR